MRKILIATPMMPPTSGGPATHAKKLYEHFGYTLFNFEKYTREPSPFGKNYPSGIRHLMCLWEFVSPFTQRGLGGFRDHDLILALDGFTVALPSVLAGIILGKKVILRIGGDFIYEEFLNTKEITFGEFYNNFTKYKQLMSYKLYIKYLVQKFVLENCYGIIFNTEWQKDIYIKHYSLPSTSPALMERVGNRLWVVQNPVEPILKETYENSELNINFQDALNKNKYIFTSITRDIPYKNLTRLKQVFNGLEGDFFLETVQGSHESCLKRISLSRAYICASVSDISPNQVQEALSLRIPVVISKYTGITKILELAGVARVVDPFDLQDIEKAVLDMTDDKIYENYKKNLENFKWEQSWSTLFKQYENIIEQVCNKN